MNATSRQIQEIEARLNAAKEDIGVLLKAYRALRDKAEVAFEILGDTHTFCESCHSWCPHEDFIGSNCGDYEGFCSDCYAAAKWECADEKCSFRTNGQLDFGGTCPECGNTFRKRRNEG